MTDTAPRHRTGEQDHPQYSGLLMTADEYFGMLPDGFDYELIDGVMVLMQPPNATGLHHGVRLSAVEYFDLPDDGQRYELVHGILLMTPSPSLRHQAIVGAIFAQIFAFVQRNPIGRVFVETDVHLGKDAAGADLVYRPDVFYVRNEVIAQMREHMIGPPDVVVEVVSPGGFRYDSETKGSDYERAKVREYWLIDPERNALQFFRLHDDRFVDVRTMGDRFASEAIPGFELDIVAIRREFDPW